MIVSERWPAPSAFALPSNDEIAAMCEVLSGLEPETLPTTPARISKWRQHPEQDKRHCLVIDTIDALSDYAESNGWPEDAPDPRDYRIPTSHELRLCRYKLRATREDIEPHLKTEWTTVRCWGNSRQPFYGNVVDYISVLQRLESGELEYASPPEQKDRSAWSLRYLNPEDVGLSPLGSTGTGTGTEGST